MSRGILRERGHSGAGIHEETLKSQVSQLKKMTLSEDVEGCVVAAWRWLSHGGVV